MSSVIISGDTSGAITLAAPAVSGTNTATLPAATGTVMVSGNMPAFSYGQTVAQTLSAGTFTKITFTTSDFDTTSGMFSSSRFTPTVNGYYQINACVSNSGSGGELLPAVYRNGAAYRYGNDALSGSLVGSTISALVYLNGSTDYVEIWGYFSTGQNTSAQVLRTYFQGCLVRTA
jgi:hypothetical protein